MKKRKYVEELNLASGTEMMRASQMRPSTFKDKSKYTRKTKHKNRQDKNSGDYSLGMIFIIPKNFCQKKAEFSLCCNHRITL
jgi:hypothetical protein